MRVVIAATGSRGDLQPMTALGRELGARGHEVLVCGPPDLAGLAEEFGVPYLPFGIPVGEFLARFQEMAERKPVRIFMGGLARHLLGEQMDAVGPQLIGADILVGHFSFPSGATMAEAAGIPYVKAILQPTTLRAPAYPPLFVSSQDLPGWVNLRLWDFFGWVLNRSLLGPLNERRRSLGLAPITDLSRHVWETSNFLVAVDPALTGPLPEWGFPHVVTGVWQVRDTEAHLPAEVEAYLAAGPPPVYVGFGSMTAGDPARRTRLLLDGVRAAGQRAIVSAGWGGLGEAANLPEGCMTIGPVSHAALFPRCHAIVHHGGAGTTAAAALSGRPQVVVPHLLDQHYWAHRVEQCGLGPRAFTVHKLSASRLAFALRQACENPAYRERAEAVSQELWRRDGLAEAVAAIEAEVMSFREPSRAVRMVS